MILFPRLQRELFKEMVLVALICLGALLGLLLLGRLLQLRELFLAQGVGLFDLAKLFVYLSPFFLLLLVPASCMLGLFLTILRMGADQELISLRAGGISLWRLVPAPFLLSLVCSGLTLWVSLTGIAWGMENFRETIIQIARNNTSLSLRPGVFNTSFRNLTLYARQADSLSGELEGVFVVDSSHSDAPATIMATSGRVESDAAKGIVYVLLQDGHIYYENNQELSVASFDQYILSLDMSRLLGGIKIDDLSPKEMSWSALAALAANPADAADLNFYRRILIERHKRLALPLACLALSVFALPLAFFFQGVRRQYGLVVSLGAFFLYYVLLTAGMSLAEGGKIAPGLALWTPNVLFSGLGVLGMWLAAQEWEPRQIMALLRAWRSRLHPGAMQP
ncbi:LPS export ABC transporter permease LptF [Desulfovibrionales bacterium]